MLWFALYGSANFFINSLAQHTMIHMGSDYKGLIINPLWVIQHSRYIIYTVNEYISGKLLLTGLHVYNTHQEHPQGHTLPIIIEATKKTGQLQITNLFHQSSNLVSSRDSI